MELHQLIDDLHNTKYSDFDHLPDIDLYLDQVITYLSRDQIQGSPEAELTSSMVNNYVKEKLLPRANGKKYDREHLVYLKMINALKQVYNVKEIKAILNSFTPGQTAPEIFDTYQRALIDATDQVAADLDKSNGEHLAIRLAVQSYVYKMVSQRLLQAVSQSRK